RADGSGQGTTVPAARAVAVHAHQNRFAEGSVPHEDVKRAVAVVANQIVRTANENDEAPVRANAGVVAIGRRAFNSDGGNGDCLRRAAILAGAEQHQREQSNRQHYLWFKEAFHLSDTGGKSCRLNLFNIVVTLLN